MRLIIDLFVKFCFNIRRKLVVIIVEIFIVSFFLYFLLLENVTTDVIP